MRKFLMGLAFSIGLISNVNAEVLNNSVCENRYNVYANSFLIGHNYTPICFSNFQIYYDQKSQNPKIVRYTLSKEQISVCTSRSEEAWRNWSFGPNVNALKGTKFDRGHLVPDKDMAWKNEAQAETYYSINFVPQFQKSNRGVWLELETHFRNIIFETGGAYVLKGVFGSLGTVNGINVPEYFWGLIINPWDGSYEAYVIPHSDERLNLEQFQVSFTALKSKVKELHHLQVKFPNERYSLPNSGRFKCN